MELDFSHLEKNEIEVILSDILKEEFEYEFILQNGISYNEYFNNTKDLLKLSLDRILKEKRLKNKGILK